MDPDGYNEPSQSEAALTLGLTAKADLVVTEADTALALSSGDVCVLATPRLIALCEQASFKAVRDLLAAGQTCVATRVQFDHLAPVALGRVVTAEANLVRIEGKRLTFTISATIKDIDTDSSSLVGAGRLTRVIINEEAFLSKANKFRI